MSGAHNFEIPEEVAALIPDEVSSNQVSPKAQKTVTDIEQELGSCTEKMIEAARTLPRAKVAINGIFKHPSEFTEEEWEIIVAGLRAHLPLYAIATRVNCERHFLSQKIRENQEVLQLLKDAKEGIIDDLEYQMIKAARSGSVSATIYMLDHLGQDRGYGEQGQNRESTENVQIMFSEISQKDLDEAQKQIAEANTKVTPTLAAELANMEIPQKASVQDLAMAEDMINEIKKSTAPAPVEIPTPPVSQPPYAQHEMSDDKYKFYETVFGSEGDSPFANF